MVGFLGCFFGWVFILFVCFGFVFSPLSFHPSSNSCLLPLLPARSAGAVAFVDGRSARCPPGSGSVLRSRGTAPGQPPAGSHHAPRPRSAAQLRRQLRLVGGNSRSASGGGTKLARGGEETREALRCAGLPAEIAAAVLLPEPGSGAERRCFPWDRGSAHVVFTAVTDNIPFTGERQP